MSWISRYGVLAPALAGAVALAGCGSSPHNSAATSAGSGGAAPVSVATSSSPTITHKPAAPPMTADAVAQGLKGKGLPIAAITVYTAATDPNNLLGRPGGYTSKVSFTDSRLDQSNYSSDPGGVEFGGSVEVYPDSAGATRRAHYIQSIVQAAPMLGTEYDFVDGGILLRVAGGLTPTEASGYKQALSQVTGVAPQLITSGS